MKKKYPELMENDFGNVDNVGSDDDTLEVNANNRLDKEFC